MRGTYREVTTGREAVPVVRSGTFRPRPALGPLSADEAGRGEPEWTFGPHTP